MKITKSRNKFIISITLCLILILSVVPSFATVGTYEYNDFILYSASGTEYTHNAFRSNNPNLTQFTLTINVNNNTWMITDGTSTAIPFPSGVSIQYTDRATFLQQAYYIVNNTRYSFTYVSGDDSSGNFYSHTITTNGYPYVYVYLPTTGTSQVIPTTPILSVTNNQDSANWLSWTPTGYAAELYRSDDAHLAGDAVSLNAQTPFKVTETGYYYVRLKYSQDGVTRYTDNSNRVYAEYIDDSNTEPPDENGWQKLLRFFDNIINGMSNATSTLGRFVGTLREFISMLFSWLPEEVTSVFIAVVIVGLVIGLFLK